MQSVLLTGASGFIGRQCLASLTRRGVQVHAVASPQSTAGSASDDGVTWHQVDLLDAEAIVQLVETVQATHLLHLAWYAVPGKYWTSMENFRWVESSLRLARAFANGGGKRVVSAGTCAEYDWSHGKCSEASTPVAPGTTYGICKDAWRRLQGAFCERAALSGAWGRIFFLYGPGESPQRLVPSVIQALRGDERAACTEGHQERDFLHVSDVAEAFVQLLDSDVQGPVNIGSGNPVSVRTVAQIIGDALQAQDRIDFGARPSPANDPPLILADNRRLTEEVGWLPQFDLEAGLQDTIDWWKGQDV